MRIRMDRSITSLPIALGSTHRTSLDSALGVGSPAIGRR
jgi:hypothetical protein